MQEIVGDAKDPQSFGNVADLLLDSQSVWYQNWRVTGKCRQA